MDYLEKVQKSLCDFIIEAAKEGTSSSTVQVLPEAVKSLVELSRFIIIQK
jgi:hypothetical protein